jgi:hypothetical protein
VDVPQLKSFRRARDTRRHLMMRRVGAVTATLVLTASAAAAVLLSTPATAAPDPDCTTATNGHTSNRDINGDSFTDVVVGVPHATSVGAPGAGVVDIHYPFETSGLATQRFGEEHFGITPAAHDNFGASVSITQFGPATTCADLVIGAPGADGGKGEVTLGQGSNAGIKSDDDFRIPGQAAGDHFGAAVAADGPNIWIGAPGRTVDGREGAGALYHYFLKNGTQLNLVQVITEDSPGIPGDAEAGDHFGQVLALNYAGKLAIGEPGEDVGSVPDAGAVTVLATNFKTGNKVSSAAKVWQDSPHVSGTSERADGFGSSVSWVSPALVVGVPGEDIGHIRNAGMVQTFEVSSANYAVKPVKAWATVTQESAKMPGASEPGDRFGAAVQGGNGSSVWIGVPGESLGSVATTGDVIRTHMSFRTGRLTPFGYVIRLGGGGPDNIPGAPQAAAHVGSSLSLLAYGNLDQDQAGGESVMVSVPGLEIDSMPDAGEVWASQDGDDSGSAGAGVYRDSNGPRAHELYGAPAGTVTNGGQTLN